MMGAIVRPDCYVSAEPRTRQGLCAVVDVLWAYLAPQS
jgi:hypothetical protein